jgi:hypothetical protein
MTPVNQHKAGFAVAALLGGWHLLWSSLVALGLAQPLIDFVFWMHFLKPIYVIEPFSLGRAAILIVRQLSAHRRLRGLPPLGGW